MSQSETPIERFKRATGAALRALAEQADLTVSFTPSGQGLVGKEARLPMPARDLPAEEVAQVRGEADAIALRQRFHNAKLHATQRPQTQTAREIFDAVEQVRC